MKQIWYSVLGLLLMAPSLRGSAQHLNLRWGPYAELALPTGSMASRQASGLGTGLQLELRLPVGLALDGSAGYLRFPAAGVDSAAASVLSAVPFRVGARFKFLPLLYVKLETGRVVYLHGAPGGAALWAPGLGLQLLGLDLEAKYEIWDAPQHQGFLGLKLAYLF